MVLMVTWLWLGGCGRTGAHARFGKHTFIDKSARTTHLFLWVLRGP